MFLPPSEWLIFFSYFYPIRKYSKYSLNLTFGWECNDTSSLRIQIKLELKNNNKKLVNFGYYQETWYRLDAKYLKLRIHVYGCHATLSKISFYPIKFLRVWFNKKLKIFLKFFELA